MDEVFLLLLPVTLGVDLSAGELTKSYFLIAVEVLVFLISNALNIKQINNTIAN